MLSRALKLLLLLTAAYLCVFAQEHPEPSEVRPSIGTSCCHALSAMMPSMVFSNGTPEYDARHMTYYSLQQQELFPTCTVMPTSAVNVSLIVKFANANQCPFAVASGGHMSWAGSSNIEGGFVIDMRSLNQIDISVQDQTVMLGPGSPWTNVYNAMTPFNVTTTGARINTVGVAGFLLGAFASVTKGFGADNVFNYEVVLANGSIVEANKDMNSDLFWSLKFAGSNYGIVTRFDMNTYPSAAIWGAVISYPYTNQSTSDLLTDYANYGHDDSNTHIFKAISFVHSNGTDTASIVEVNLNPIPLANVTSVPALVSFELTGPTHDVISEVIANALASTARTEWYTITTEIDSDLFTDIYEGGLKIFEPLEDREGFTLATGIQSFQKSFIEGAAGTPVYNALKQPNADLVCILLMATWTNPADDVAMKAAVLQFGAWAEAEALNRGLLASYIYLNYANEQQLIYERSVTPNDLNTMRKIQKKYDPSGVFTQLWRGGYKIPQEGYTGPETGPGFAEVQNSSGL
ncbi:FAD-binding domain-containing protein [Gymnopus androsaceus JB14]|uniref:FAD-binding domain-containing protein n=1 Tax=Gymnopus androsaceus JB14 TaxID=1447944 RepID=A0A6A4HWM7_9AGAR|nr:FAD-binding domain-containing protein [Gymnopus androsaceus JB14]